MENNTIQNIEFEDLDKQKSVKVLSNEDELYAIWIENDKIIMQFHYSRKDNEMKLLDGSLGNSIKAADLSKEEKAQRCSEAIGHALWDYYHKPKSPKRKIP